MFLQYLSKNTLIEERFSLQRVDKDTPMNTPAEHWPNFEIMRGTNEIQTTNYDMRVKYVDLKETIFKYTRDFHTLKDFAPAAAGATLQQF